MDPMTVHSEKTQDKPSRYSELRPSQNDGSEHQKSGEERENREGPEILDQATVGQNTPAAAADREDTREQKQSGQGVAHSAPIRDWQGIVALSSLAVAILGVGTLFVTIVQLSTMSDQLAEMKNANERTDKAIVVAGRQAKAAEDANNIAKHSIAISQNPVVYPEVSLKVPANAGDKFEAAVVFHNFGRTPAANLKGKFQFGLQEPNASLIYPDVSKENSATILPGGSISKTYKSEIAYVPDAKMFINFGGRQYYITGTVSYLDPNGEEILSRACYYFSPQDGNVQMCLSGQKN